MIATIDLVDEIKAGARETIQALKVSGMRVLLISGDKKSACEKVCKEVGIEEIYSEQLPRQKLERIESLSKESPTAMVGDGINDAPALAKASLGISMSNATDVAIQSAQVILLHQEDLRILLKAIAIGKATYKTIRQNLFWAFFYNVVAIPIAAAGFLSPMIGALSMAFSDDENGKIIHVGILLNDHEIIHAAGKVRIDKIDNQGIINSETGERTSRLRVIKRYL